MRSQTHVVIANFEKRILKPLNFGYYAIAVYYFWQHSWAMGIAILVLSVVIGAIGQGLPHRKGENVSELASGEKIGRAFEGELSYEDRDGLARACLFTVFLIVLTTPIILWHEGWRWYWIVLAVLGEFPLLPIALMTLSVGPLNIVRVLAKKRHSP